MTSRVRANCRFEFMSFFLRWMPPGWMPVVGKFADKYQCNSSPTRYVFGARKLVSGSSLQMSRVFSDGHGPQVGRGADRHNRAIARFDPRHSLAWFVFYWDDDGIVPQDELDFTRRAHRDAARAVATRQWHHGTGLCPHPSSRRNGPNARLTFVNHQQSQPFSRACSFDWW